MNQVLVAHDRDADKIPANIKDGVEIDGVVGTYEGGLINTNLKPVHYKGVNGLDGGLIDIASKEYCTQYNGGLFFFNPIYRDVNNRYRYVIRLDLATFVVTEYAQTGIWQVSNVTGYYVDGNILRVNYDTDNMMIFDMDTLTFSMPTTGGPITTGTPMVNTPITVGGNTFVTRTYVNSDTLKNTGFFIS